MKPIGLIAKLLKNSMVKGEIVLDPFGGSGSTLIAAEQLGLTSAIVELDPKYCDVIIERWESLTGKQAELLLAKAD
jgi:site-specific DNA-methyltransferase (adenine-specific)